MKTKRFMTMIMCAAFVLALFPATVLAAAPVAANDMFTVAKSTATTLDVLANDLNGATSIVVAGAVPAHGTASVSGTAITYTSDAGYTGTDSFTYTAVNSDGTSAPATVTLAVVQPLVVNGGTGYTYTGDTLTFTGNGSYSVSMFTAGSTTKDKIAVSSGVNADITLSDVRINTSGCAFDMAGATVNLTLAGINGLSSSNNAGLHCPSGATLTISGSGSLTATGSSKTAGIGGGYGQSGGNITISDGTILAEAGNQHGAGIGGGAEGGGGNITITGGNVTANGHYGGAGIGSGIDTTADDVTNITISDGVITANGESSSAGIGGGGYNMGEMNITITGGTVIANGPDFGAGIGGGIGNIGLSGGGGNITISGGDVTANGGETSPGIGNGAFAAAGAETNIAISGGKVTATSTGSYTFSGSKTSGGAAIGSGYEATGCNIVISGGEVTATAGIGSAGIGGGVSANGGTVAITGGAVYAAMGTGAAHDIGTGLNGTDGTLAISGTAAVFLAHNSCVAPTTAAHTHLAYTTDTEESYGYDIPNAWTPTFGAYLRLVTLSYNAGSGSGTVNPVTQIYNSTATVSNGSGLSRTYYVFDGWNTTADGSGTSYAAGSTYSFTADTRLYAQWKAMPALTSSVLDGRIYTGARVTLTPNIDGGTWAFDSAYLSRDGNTFTALKAGTSPITYTVDGVSTSYQVTIAKSELPPTGQDFAWAWICAGAALVATAAGTLLRRRLFAQK